MIRYELVIIWDDDETEVHGYRTEAEAQEAEAGYKKVFGYQIKHSYTRRVVYG